MGLSIGNQFSVSLWTYENPYRKLHYKLYWTTDENNTFDDTVTEKFADILGTSNTV